MKSRLLLLFLLFTAACTFQVQVFDTPTAPSTEAILAPNSTATTASEVLPTSTPLFTFTTALPTFVINPASPTPVPPSPVIPTLPPDGIIPIQFEANGTAASVFGTADAGSSKTYSLTAFGGQIMSVSVGPEQNHPERTFQLEIKGQDGTVLCPIQNNSCGFWRGTLPSTQKYFIKVMPQSSGFFDLVVAINPPGQAHQYFNYSDPLGRFQLSYSDEFAYTYYAGVQVTKFPPQFVLQYIDTKQYTSTNLNEAYFMMGSSTDSQAVANCTQPLSFGGPETIVGNVTINGVTFTKSQGGGVAAGNIYEQTYYRGVRNGTCYEITYYVHYGNIGNYDPATVKEFDHDALIHAFDEVLNTITFK
jgi:hypothetical protein